MQGSTGIKDLPLVLREKIVTILVPDLRSPRVHPTLRHREHLHEDLPLELLAPAQSSPVILSAVASVLGPRSRFITHRVSNARTADWVRALAPYVQAVSFHDPKFVNLRRTRAIRCCRPDKVLREGLALIEAVSEPLVALRVLDLSHVPVHFDDLPKDKFYGALITALRHNAITLRELSLPVSLVCARALEEVNLPALEVAEFDFRSHNMWEARHDNNPLTCDLARMLRALQKSGRDGKVVRDLRLVNMKNKVTELDGLSREFLRGLTALDVGTARDAKDESLIATLPSFPELRIVRWNLRLTEAGMQELVAACPLLEEIHANSDKLYVDKTHDAHNEHDGDASKLPNVFEATRGKLRSITLRGNISASIIHALGDSSPLLEKLALDVRPTNVSALVPLLTSKCRKLQCLELRYVNDPTSMEMLGTVGWRSLTAAVCGASDALRIVTVMNSRKIFSTESDIEGAVADMCEMLKRLGDRAEKIVFHVPVSISEYRVLIGATLRVMEAAKKWCGNLEYFKVDLMSDNDYLWDSEEEAQTECARLRKERDKFWKSKESLHFLSLGSVETLSQENGFGGPVWIIIM